MAESLAPLMDGLRRDGAARTAHKLQIEAIFDPVNTLCCQDRHRPGDEMEVAHNREYEKVSRAARLDQREGRMVWAFLLRMYVGERPGVVARVPRALFDWMVRFEVAREATPDEIDEIKRLTAPPRKAVPGGISNTCLALHGGIANKRR